MVVKRKIQLTGRSTYTISLPRDWIERYKIEQGEELSILEQADALAEIGFGEKSLEGDLLFLEDCPHETVAVVGVVDDGLRREVEGFGLDSQNPGAEGVERAEQRGSVKPSGPPGPIR